MPWENPWAYHEARKRIRENQETEAIIVARKIENFEKEKQTVRKKKTLDIFELKRRLETGKSLNNLKSDIEEALKEGTISFETYEHTIRNLQEKNSEEMITEKDVFGDVVLPFSQNKLTNYLENKKFGENPLVDLLGLMYGFFIQWSALLVILVWNMLIDLLRLPKDIIWNK